MAAVRGIRGATTAESNTKDAILEATQELLERLIEANRLDPDDVAAAMFTTTADLNAEFPAVAARRLGWEYVALMDGQEISVPDDQARCIRVLLLVNTDTPARELRNIYLRDAVNLRYRALEDG
jgi:chorismate mutase